MLLATLFFGATAGVFAATLNNYLSEVHGFGASERGWLELPRELPGFLIFFVMGLLLMRLRESRIAALAMIFTAAGALGLGFLAPGTTWVVVWIVVWSLGDHIIFATEGPLGLKLAVAGGEGRRLGQLGGARNLGTIVGVGLVWLLARLVGDRFDLFYLIAGCCAVVAGWFYFRLDMGRTDPPSRR
ncbi:hypothetical protein DRQ50_03655, partial [bacterium]